VRQTSRKSSRQGKEERLPDISQQRRQLMADEGLDHCQINSRSSCSSRNAVIWAHSGCTDSGSSLLRAAVAGLEAAANPAAMAAAAAAWV